MRFRSPLRPVDVHSINHSDSVLFLIPVNNDMLAYPKRMTTHRRTCGPAHVLRLPENNSENRKQLLVEFVHHSLVVQMTWARLCNRHRKSMRGHHEMPYNEPFFFFF